MPLHVGGLACVSERQRVKRLPSSFGGVRKCYSPLTGKMRPNRKTSIFKNSSMSHCVFVKATDNIKVG